MKKLLFSILSLFVACAVMADSHSTSEAIPVHLVNPGWDNQVEETGQWTMSAYSSDSMYWVFLSNYTPVSQVAGTYTTFDMDEILTFLYDMERTGPSPQMFSDLTVQIDSVNDKYVISAIYETLAGLTYHITVDSIPVDNLQNITSVHCVKDNAINNGRKVIINGKPLLWNENRRFLLNGQMAQ